MPSIKQTLLLKCMFYAFKIFGLSTMSLDGRNLDKNFSPFKPSRLGILYNVILMIVVMILASITYVGLPNTDYPGKVKLDSFVDTVQGASTFLSCEVILMVFGFKQGKSIAIAENLCLAKRLSNGIRSKRNDERGIISTNLTMIFCVNVSVLFLLIATAPKGDYYAVVYDVSIFSFYVIVACMLIQYCVAVRLLGHFFEIVNDDLMDFSMNSHGAPDAKRIFNRFRRLHNLRKLYSMLSDSSRDISDFYSQPMLLCTVHIFMALILSSYYCTKPLFINQDGMTFVLYFHCFLHALLNGIPLVVLTKCISDTIAESKKTGRILSEPLETFGDQNIKKELKSFSNYLLHNNVKFAVFDLFPLDQTLLVSIAGSVTTYLVIIMQFQQDSDK